MNLLLGQATKFSSIDSFIITIKSSTGGEWNESLGRGEEEEEEKRVLSVLIIRGATLGRTTFYVFSFMWHEINRSAVGREGREGGMWRRLRTTIFNALIYYTRHLKRDFGCVYFPFSFRRDSCTKCTFLYIFERVILFSGPTAELREGVTPPSRCHTQ